MTAAEYTAIMKNRENFYRFLQRFYYKEVTLEFLNQLRGMTFPQNCGQKELQEGYDLMEKFITMAGDGMVDELAADYAKVFLAAGEYQGKGAFPYESVYTSKQGLVMQEAWEQVKAVYAAHHLGLAEVPSDMMEDHIAIELQYMAQLCARTIDNAEGGLLQDQVDFLNMHLLNWVPSMCADMEKYARTDFYKAVAKMTLGFLKMDLEMLKEIQSGEDGVSVSCSATVEEMDAILAKLSKDYKIYAPRRTGKKGRNGHEIIRYGEISSVKEIVYDRQSDFSAKEVYYPVMQTMIYFTEDTSTESKVQDDRGLLIFAHPCDINAIRRLDNIFLKNGDQADIYYKRLRDKVKMVLMECTESYENCYCVSMGSNVAENYSLAVRLGEDSCQVQVKDAFFLPYFAGQKESDFAPKFITENERKAVIPVIEGKEDLKTASNLEFWTDYDETCISCGGCNTVCPTCSCFDTVDVIYDEMSKDGERRRVWSSCMLESFTRTAGGARARKTPGANMRFKTLHKVYDYKLRFEADEHMCVGCGRCTLRCPKEIDFLLAINRLHDEMEKAKAGKEDAE